MITKETVFPPGTTTSKIPGTNIETGWVYVNPDLAAFYLQANVNNRSQRAKHIDRLSNDMKGDRFDITHQGVAFDENGCLIDGQHRLTALIDSKIEQWLLVTIELSEEAKRVIDGGAKRAAADFMPGKFKSLRAAGIRIMLAVETLQGEFTAGQLQQEIQQVTSAAIQENWDTFADNFDEMCGLASDASRSVATCGPGALLAAGLLYPGTSKEYLIGLATMAGLEQGDPRLALLKFRGGAKRIQTPTAAFVAIKCAKAFAYGKKMSMLRYSPGEKLKV